MEGQIRLGLCCIFRDEPIKFRTTTVKACQSLTTAKRQTKLAEICLHNAEALYAALNYCATHGIGCFRVNSQILPVKTHAEVGYDLEKTFRGERRFLINSMLVVNSPVSRTSEPVFTRINSSF
ncbi:MAG: hypothetical protein R3C11_17715 [Planctomycetaceae bacterium]